jgi:uncharacterized membrane protein YbhN (UPF0104 family)
MGGLARFLGHFRGNSVRAKKLRTTLWFAVRLLVSATLILWLILKFDWGETWQALTRISLGGIVLLILGLLLNRLVAFARFWVLLRSEGMEIDLGTVIRISFLATFTGNFLPTTVGGDVAKIGWMASRPDLRKGNDPATVPALRIAFWTLFDRLSNMLAIGLLAPFCLLLPFFQTAIPRWPGEWSPDPLSTFLVFVALNLAAGLALGLGTQRSVNGGLWRKVFSRRRTFGLLTLISMVSIVPNLLTTWLAARDLGMNVELWGVTAVYVVIYFVTLLPVSFNGLGLQEVSTVALYASLGAAESQAAALAILMRFAIWITTFPGAFWLTRGIPSKPAPEQIIVARPPQEPGPNA